MEYDVVSGVSAGSFNTLGVAAFKKGDEENMLEWLIKMWTSLKESDIFERYPEGIVRAIFDEPSLLTTKPLFKFLREKYEEVKPIKDRNVFWNCADANSGSFV